MKRKIASTANVRDRLRIVEDVLEEGINRQRVQSDVAKKVRVDLDQRQRESLLRAQMKTIRRELGEEGDSSAEVEELKERVKAAGLPKEVDEAAAREIERLAGMSPQSAEYHVARTYVGWILDLPWNAVSKSKIDLEKARAILDRDHYGLDDVKERILEFLAVRKLKKDPRGPILCLAGPPGVGKTSLGKSVAEAVGRPFVRVSVGGMRDEAEIKGHRRTYVGALPGKVLQALKKAGTRDPVFMIDEIDKMGSDPIAGRPGVRHARGARPRAERQFLRPLPRPALRPLEGLLRRDGELPRRDPGAAARPHGGHHARGLHPRGEVPHREAPPRPEGAARQRAPCPSRSSSPTRGCAP